jgi:hypothetical protein
MIYIDKKKLSVDGVDVYPDHESPTQFWYVPGTIRLAQRNNKKVLSYLWYTDSVSDSDGTGFLNFEVNTAVPPETLDKIKSQISSTWGVDQKKIALATVPYQAGNVNFSVLGPVVAQAGDLTKDTSVLYQSKEQLVWNAGSSSLVGDNSAVCSVRFTKEGKLAAAMKNLLQSKAPGIAALYRLEFLALRPSVSFSVQGTFEKTIKDFKASIGTQIPLEALILDLGIQGQWQKIMQNTDLKIEVVNYTGEDPGDGLKWAQSIMLDYVLKNFFEVQLGQDANTWNPLTKEPEVNEAVQKAKDVEESAANQAESDGKTGEEKDSAVKEVVKAATMYIPKVNIRASYYQGSQVNSIDFLYSEKKAKAYPIMPQSLVSLDSSDKPEDYITQVNRSQVPFGLPYNVVVSVPSDADRAKVGLQTVNVQASYPADSPRSTNNLTINGTTVTGANPIPFQFDSNGSSDVAYETQFVFQPSGDWDGNNKFQYDAKGRTSTGLVVAVPESVVEFLTLTVDIDPDFSWEETIDQAVVTITSEKWSGDKRVVFTKRGKNDPQTLRIRCDAQFQAKPVNYRVDVQKGTRTVYSYGPQTVMDKHITVTDRFQDHVPVYFTAGFTDEDSVDITLRFQDVEDDGTPSGKPFTWEDQFTLSKGDKKIERVVPVPLLKTPRTRSQLQFQYEVDTDSGDSFQGTLKGGTTRMIKVPVPAAQ